MKNLAFLFVFAAIVACNTQVVEEAVPTEELVEVEVNEVEVTDSTVTLILDTKEENPVTE